MKSVLAEGARGTVYLAEHCFMGWRAAVKVLRPSLLDDTLLVSRFTNQARAAKAIVHPNVVEIIDVGVLPDGRPYVLMELLQGENLGARLKNQGRLELGQALDITRQAAAGLAAAHDAGIIHRDLKPDNLFLIRDPEDPAHERVKVIDFGMAKLRDDAVDGGSRLRTNAGVLLGTPAYMSPEQCRGLPIDHRSDVYALTCILYQMLAGKPPFSSSGVGDVLIMHVRAAPPGIRLENPAVPESVENAIWRGLAKQPEQRFQSMSDLVGALIGRGQQTVVLPAPRAAASLQPTRLLATPAIPGSWFTWARRESGHFRGQVRAIVIAAAIAVPTLLLIGSDVVRLPAAGPPSSAPTAVAESGLTPEDRVPALPVDTVAVSIANPPLRLPRDAGID